MQFNNPASTKNENEKYDNFTLKEIKRPVASAACFPSHPVCHRIVRAFANEFSPAAQSGTGRRVSQRQHR